MNRGSVAIGAALTAAAALLFSGQNWPYLLVGAGLALLISIVLLLVFVEDAVEVDPFWIKKWIAGAHYAHGGTSPYGAFPLAACTEPECEEGRAFLELWGKR